MLAAVVMLLYSCCNSSSVGVDDRCDVPNPEQMRDVAERLIWAANADRRIVDDRAAICLPLGGVLVALLSSVFYRAILFIVVVMMNRGCCESFRHKIWYLSCVLLGKCKPIPH